MDNVKSSCGSRTHNLNMNQTVSTGHRTIWCSSDRFTRLKISVVKNNCLSRLVVGGSQTITNFPVWRYHLTSAYLVKTAKNNFTNFWEEFSKQARHRIYLILLMIKKGLNNMGLICNMMPEFLWLWAVQVPIRNCHIFPWSNLCFEYFSTSYQIKLKTISFNT